MQCRQGDPAAADRFWLRREYLPPVARVRSDLATGACDHHRADLMQLDELDLDYPLGSRTSSHRRKPRRSDRPR